jgi:hypothetical protein
MNYNLEQRVTQPEYNIDIGGRYGDMPTAMLMSKFEETNAGPDESLYDDYARNTLTNWGPDTNLMEHERPRGGVNRRYGVLELRTNGHRGTADVEKPEIFLGFGGPEDRDPRGVNVDPDMKQLTRQERARMRFQRFTPDHSEHVTGGGRSEARVIADNQKLFKIRKERLKVFDRQIDGRREGLRRTYDHKSDVTKQVLVQSYGDYIKDYAMNPQRRANIISKNIIRDTRAWRDETADQDMEVAIYSQICRRRKIETKANRQRDTTTDYKWEDGAMSKSFKAAGLLMSHLCRREQQQDTDLADQTGTQHRKTGPYKDLMIIMESVTQDGKFKESDNTQARKQQAPVQQEHGVRTFVTDHVTPAHHLLNAEIIYKAVKQGRDLTTVKTNVVTDSKDPHIQDTLTAISKTSVQRTTATGRKLDTADDGSVADNDSEQTVNYKRLLASRTHRINVTSGHAIKGESDDSQIRKQQHQELQTVDPTIAKTGTDFGENFSLERKIAPVGSKYTRRYQTRDNDIDDVNL